MPDALTARSTVVADRIIELLEPRIQDESFFSPGLRGVCYGDQLLIPDVPWVCVEPGQKTRSWPPTPTDMTENTLEVSLYVYYMNSETGVSASQRTCDQFAEAVEFYINGFRQMTNASGDRIVVYSAVTNVMHGYSRKQNGLFRSVLMSWRGLTKTRLTDPA